jgi:type IX secretion system PorP/SprF family membrane protein
MKAQQIRKTILLVLVIGLSLSVRGQQDPQYTQYMYNMNLVNPAYAGTFDAMAINFLGRSQWVGIDGAPQTLTFNIHAPVGKRLGLGFSVVGDKIGPLNEQLATADFSYTIPTSETANLAFGIKAGFSFVSAPLQFLSTVNSGDLAFANELEKVLPNIGFGLYYYTDRFYIGASIPNVLETFHFEKSNGAVTRASDQVHYFISSGYVFDLSSTLKFKPSTLVKAVPGAPLSVDLSGNFLFNEKFEAGLSYRLDESVSTMFNVRATKNLRIGYAYDYTLTNLGDFNYGTHEVFVLFDFNFVRDNIKSPRFF